MTLITNEIHMYDGFDKTRMVFAADRRLSNLDGSFGTVDKPKLLSIPYLNGAVSYFGLATVFPKNRSQYLADWLAAFIQINARLTSLGDFATSLRDGLHRVIPRGMFSEHTRRAFTSLDTIKPASPSSGIYQTSVAWINSRTPVSVTSTVSLPQISSIGTQELSDGMARTIGQSETKYRFTGMEI